MENLIFVVGLQAVGWVVAVAVNRERIRALERRMKVVELAELARPKDYVPRSEVELILGNIAQQTGRTHELVKAIARGERGIALQSVEAAAVAGQADLVSAYLPVARTFEGCEPFMYLDIDGLVTYGIGCMSPSANDIVKLPWRGQSTGLIADEATIRAEYARVKALPAGRVAKFYFESSSLVLNDADVDELFAQKCDGFIGALRRIFPSFDSFLLSKQVALLDMVFNLGVGRPRAGTVKGSGFLAYSHLCAAVLARDWTTAATVCGRDTANPTFAPRNDWTRTQLLLKDG